MGRVKLSAAASLLRNESDGVVFILSNLEITDWRVLSFFASCACVSLFLILARIIARAISNSGLVV